VGFQGLPDRPTFLSSAQVHNILVTGGAGFIGSNLVLELQSRYPDARIFVVDDFRSGDFRNLQGFRGLFLAADVSRLDWRTAFEGTTFDAIFHEASITDTTEHGQFLQGHDNIEGFRRLLEFAKVTQTPVVYASSAATYGICSGIQREDQPALPANIYAFTKVQLDNLARDYARRFPTWRIIGLRYFNVYGPGEFHKKSAASMIYQLYRLMKSGKPPRVFKAGEHRRDFVYVKDVVAMTIHALLAKQSGIYNCGSGASFSFNETIAVLNQVLGLTMETEYFENPYAFYQPHTEADMSKAKQELGFVPSWLPAAGIADYIRWLELHPRI
jgi:ADP-L-glycero-D-manno-heptose 6-epimerase